MSDNDPQPLSPDQRDLQDALEQVALLPDGLTDDEIAEPVDRAVTLLENRVQHFHGRELRDSDLLVYERGFRRDGHDLAADGLVRLLQRLEAEIAHVAGNN
jgi:hypothetical protein